MKGSSGRAHISSPLSAIRGIGPARERTLNDFGLVSVRNLLQHLPLRYEDRSVLTSVEQIDCEGEYALEGTISSVKTIFAPRRLRIVRAQLQDSSGTMPVIWFNQPYLGGQLVEGTPYFLYGRARRRSGRFEMVNPTWETIDQRRTSPVIRPIYRSIGPVGSKLIAGFIAWIFENVDLDLAKQEWIPASLLQRHGLPSLGQALSEIHRPTEGTDIESLNRSDSSAHHRLIYAELLRHQLEISSIRAERAGAARKSHSYKIDRSVRRRLAAIVPFELTAAQNRVLDEIFGDLQQPQVMMRLLQGDVGSGKTIVAALAAVVALESGLQVAFMAPTELLAHQHFRSLGQLLGSRYRVSLLTSSMSTASQVRKDLARGQPRLVVGTHALIQESVQIPRLGLAIVDEQHRFGVAQRRDLQKKGSGPDLLIMTATPIPRSLTLTLYGDLSRSTLDELPPGRVPIETEVCSEELRIEVYARLRRRLDKGHQAYVVFPLIERSGEIDAASIQHEGASARELLSGYSVAEIHGRLAPDTREKIMCDFLSGAVQVLLATTIVEVGLDVPNATVMVLESAERFGLAQLHQLRGRVGRGMIDSLCIALHGNLTESAAQRLAVFESTTDGFDIAEADLRIRGPGDVLGTRQTGLPNFRIADLATDIQWIEKARRDAQYIWNQVNDSECARVRTVIESRVAKHRLDIRGG